MTVICQLAYKKTESIIAWQHLWLEIDIVSFLAIKGLTMQFLVFFFYVAQWRRRKRKCYRWLHQAQRSSKGNKRTVFTPSFCLHYIGCLLWTLLHLIFSGFHAKGYWKAVLSASWEISFFVWRDSVVMCILWQLDWWAKKVQYLKLIFIERRARVSNRQPASVRLTCLYFVFLQSPPSITQVGRDAR